MSDWELTPGSAMEWRGGDRKASGSICCSTAASVVASGVRASDLPKMPYIASGRGRETKSKEKIGMKANIE